MLNDLDETIRHLLTTAGGFDPSEIDISFEIPNREWSDKLGTRPTLNCYLFDIHERRALREEGWRVEGRGTRGSARRSPPLFFELTYLITAWTSVVEDEHFLLWRTLEILMDHPVLPEDQLQGALVDHEWPIHTSVAQLEGVLKSPGEFWTALENQLKPSLSYVVTLGRDRQARPTDAPPVRATGIRLNIPELTPAGLRLRQIFSLPPNEQLAGVVVVVRSFDEATGDPAAVVAQTTSDEAGHITFPDLAHGRYQLEAQINTTLYQRTLIVPGAPAVRASFRDLVLDQSGTPLAGVVVEVEGSDLRTTTDTGGWFELDLEPGTYTLLLWLQGWAQRRQIAVRKPFSTMRLTYGGVPTPADAR